jgi:branched-chain amino acid aminotransferase
MVGERTTEKAWHYWNGEWVDGNPAVMGALDHGAWLGSTVFDGARAFEGVTPDLDLHCQRIVRSTHAMNLKSLYPAEDLVELCRDGIAKFPTGSVLYIKPMYWAAEGFIAADPETTRFCLSIMDLPLPPDSGFSVSLSSFRRPTPETAPTNAKAACLYPNSGRAMIEVKRNGFENAVMLDMLGHVAELASANVWYAKDGEVHTPIPNGTFLAGITRARVLTLFRDAGIKTHERSISYSDLLAADEIFSTGNFGKVQPITRIEDRALQPGPLYLMARKMYWDFAHS